MSFKLPRAWRAASGPADLVFDFKIKAQDFCSDFFLRKAIRFFKPPRAWRATSGPAGLVFD